MSVYKLTEKKPMKLMVVDWDGVKNTAETIVDILKKTKWGKVEEILIYRWWKIKDNEKLYNEYGDVAVMDILSTIDELVDNDNESDIVIKFTDKEIFTISKEDLRVSTADCIVIDMKNHNISYGKKKNLKENYNFEGA